MKEKTFQIASTVLLITAAAVVFVPQASAQNNRRLLVRDASTSASASPHANRSLRVVIMQAKVETVAANSLTVSKDGKTYTVNITADTKIRRRFWGKSDLIEYSVGNMVNVWGKYTDDTKTAINATIIRNLSIQKKNGVFFGSVKSTGSGTFVLTSINRGDQTVTVSATTKLINRKGTPITASDIKVGDKVRVRGLWDRSKNTITEVVHVKDFSQPVKSPKPSTSASPSASASATTQ